MREARANDVNSLKADWVKLRQGLESHGLTGWLKEMILKTDHWKSTDKSSHDNQDFHLFSTLYSISETTDLNPLSQVHTHHSSFKPP